MFDTFTLPGSKYPVFRQALHVVILQKVVLPASISRDKQATITAICATYSEYVSIIEIEKPVVLHSVH